MLPLSFDSGLDDFSFISFFCAVFRVHGVPFRVPSKLDNAVAKRATYVSLERR